MKTIKQLEQEIENLTYHSDHHECEECKNCKTCLDNVSVRQTHQQTIAIKEMIDNLWIRKNINVFDKLSQEQVSWNNALEKILTKINGGEDRN